MVVGAVRELTRQRWARRGWATMLMRTAPQSLDPGLDYTTEPH